MSNSFHYAVFSQCPQEYRDEFAKSQEWLAVFIFFLSQYLQGYGEGAYVHYSFQNQVMIQKVFVE